jgi:hypothetical protein
MTPIDTSAQIPHATDLENSRKKTASIEIRAANTYQSERQTLMKRRSDRDNGKADSLRGADEQGGQM